MYRTRMSFKISPPVAIDRQCDSRLPLVTGPVISNATGRCVAVVYAKDLFDQSLAAKSALTSEVTSKAPNGGKQPCARRMFEACSVKCKTAPGMIGVSPGQCLHCVDQRAVHRAVVLLAVARMALAKQVALDQQVKAEEACLIAPIAGTALILKGAKHISGLCARWRQMWRKGASPSTNKAGDGLIEVRSMSSCSVGGLPCTPRKPGGMLLK